MRKFIVAIVLFLAVALIFLRFSELQNIADILHKSNWVFMTIAFLFELIWLFNCSATFGTLYRLMGLKESRSQLFLLTAAANFVNVVAPSAGIGGVAIFIDSAKRRNMPTGRIVVVGALYVLYDYAALLCMLAVGFVVLIRRNNLNAGELTAAFLLLALAMGMAALLYLGYKSAEQLGKVLAWLSRAVNWVARPFIHRDYLDVEYAHVFAREIAEGVSMLRGQRNGLIWPFLFALNNKALLICVMAFSFLALGTPFSVGTIVGGVSIAQLFVIISPTPSGVGVVEGVLPFALDALRVPWAAAVLITMVFRAVTFWFPLAVGGIAFRFLGSRKKKTSAAGDAGDKAPAVLQPAPPPQLSDDPPGEIAAELENAEHARRNGNEGQARVCARRAAGIAARDFLARNGVRARNRSAYTALLTLATFPSLSPDLQSAAVHLTTRLTEEFKLPVQADLIAEARKLIGGLEQ